MASNNHIRSSKAPTKYKFFHIIQASRNRRRRGCSRPANPRPIQPLQRRGHEAPHILTRMWRFPRASKSSTPLTRFTGVASI